MPDVVTRFYLQQLPEAKLSNALLQAPLAAGGRQWVLAFRLSPFAFRLSPFFLLQWNSTACNSSVGMAQA